MAGTIFFPSGARWTARSSVFALALEALIPMISDLETHELVVTLNEGNVGMLDVEDMPPRGRTEVLQILADGRHWESAQTMITGGQEWIDALEKPMANLSALAAAAIAKQEASDSSPDNVIRPYDRRRRSRPEDPCGLSARRRRWTDRIVLRPPHRLRAEPYPVRARSNPGHDG